MESKIINKPYEGNNDKHSIVGYTGGYSSLNDSNTLNVI